MMDGRESTVSGSPTNTETESPVSGVVAHTMNMAINMSIDRSITGGEMEMLAKKKRGRPRKYGPDGTLVPTISPRFSSNPNDFSSKRGRGRPLGSGNKQSIASLSEWVFESAGGNFLPHVVTINTGEDVAAKIHSFSQKGPRAICILSANGSISNVTIHQPGSSGGILTYEGRFEILGLTGSFSFTDTGGARSRTGALSVSLAGPDGRVIGGEVAGLLMAASPIQIVVGSFMPNIHKSHKRKHHLEPSTTLAISSAANVVTEARPISQATPDDDACVTPTSNLPEQSHGEEENGTGSNQNQNSTSFHGVGWHGSQSTPDQRPSPDINVCVPGD